MIVVVVAVGSYFLWSGSDRSDQIEIEETSTDQDHNQPAVTTDEINEETPTDDIEETPSASMTPEPAAIDYTGTHIMPDGSVMTGRGLILNDATVTADGMIRLSDGTILVPVADMRPESE